MALFEYFLVKIENRLVIRPWLPQKCFYTSFIVLKITPIAQVDAAALILVTRFELSASQSQ